MSLIGLKMRIGITTAVYRKTLEAQSINGDSPEVLNLMSTDTDRIVNSCISFHSFWSIPFQVRKYLEVMSHVAHTQLSKN